MIINVNFILMVNGLIQSKKNDFEVINPSNENSYAVISLRK